MSTPTKRVLSAVVGAACLWCVVGAAISWPQDLTTAGKKEAIQEFRRAKSAAGTEIDYTLEHESLSRYGHLDAEALTTRFGSLLAGSGFTPSTNLTLAAYEVNRFYQEHKQLAPSDVLSFILDSSGATYWGVQQIALVTINMSDTLLRKSFGNNGHQRIVDGTSAYR